MTLFLDASVVLAACGRTAGASHVVFDLSKRNGWLLVTSAYVLRDIETNLQHRLGLVAQGEWVGLRPALRVVADELSYPRVVVFPASKDKPVLFTGAAVADVLLTLDRADFGRVMETGFYNLPVMTPGDFLRREPDTGRLNP